MPGLFATQDESLHRMLKKPIASVYSMTTLVSFEPFVDSTISVFFEQLDKRFVETSTVCDWGVWLQYFAVSINRRELFMRGQRALSRASIIEIIGAC